MGRGLSYTRPENVLEVSVDFEVVNRAARSPKTNRPEFEGKSDVQRTDGNLRYAFGGS